MFGYGQCGWMSRSLAFMPFQMFSLPCISSDLRSWDFSFTFIWYCKMASKTRADWCKFHGFAGWTELKPPLRCMHKSCCVNNNGLAKSISVYSRTTARVFKTVCVCGTECDRVWFELIHFFSNASLFSLRWDLNFFTVSVVNLLGKSYSWSTIPCAKEMYQFQVKCHTKWICFQYRKFLGNYCGILKV